MDLPAELNDLLDTITDSLSSTYEALPNSIPECPNGLSILDLKNNLLLSYLQNLSLLILAKLDNPSFSLQTDPTQKIIWNLIHDRVFLEKGVFPLESKLSYQIRKLVRSAKETSKDENLKFKPNPSALVVSEPSVSSTTYKPPRISSTALPTRSNEGSRRNKVLEEFISSSSLSAAPAPVPSVGSNLTGIGSRNAYKTSKHSDITQYEEENFVRLNAKIGKEKKGKKIRSGMEGFGGEDWSGLERIGKGNWDFGKRDGKVEKSRKRGFDEGGVGDDVSGQAFEKRKKILQDRKIKKKHRGGKR
jgi:U3 small nucleolar ribonucleoprotein protein LCP5